MGLIANSLPEASLFCFFSALIGKENVIVFAHYLLFVGSVNAVLVRVRYIMLENSSIMLLSVTQKNLVLCPKLCSKNIALCSPDFFCIQHVLMTAV